MSYARYAATQNAVASPRDIELRAFRYVNGLLANGGEMPARAEALDKTSRLWTILIRDLASPGNGLPAALRGQLVSLGLWAQRECDAALGDRRSLEPLMALHRDMIAGLEGQVAARPGNVVPFAAASA